MDINTLFLKTIEDLKVKIGSEDPYEILMATALLRKLLIDESPLVDQVNKNFGLKIRYVVNNKSSPPNIDGLITWSTVDGFDPETSHISEPIILNKNQMLKRQIMIIDGTTITVLDLIKFLSHVQGSVHVRNPKNDKERVQKKFEETIKIGGMPGEIRSVKAIGRVVIKGLNQLIDKVNNLS